MSVEDKYVHYSGKVMAAKDINFEAWSRTLVSFIRSKGLEQELSDFGGGWPIPIGGTPALIAAGPDILASLKDAIDIIDKHVPRDALGVDHMGDFSVPGGVMTWGVLDEHLHYMRKAISKAEGRP